MDLTLSVRLAIFFSGIFLLIGMLTGVWKYLEIRKSPRFRAHYYVDIAHRASLMYASACLILAVLAYFSIWSEWINLSAIVANLLFFMGAVLSYILHGLLKDTTNQFQVPHRISSFSLPTSLMTLFMVSLIVAECGGVLLLLIGAAYGLFDCL